jgi:hypothetical protein
VAAAVDKDGQYCFAVALERFQAKWRPVRVKKTRQIKNLEPRFDSIETERALGRGTQIGAIVRVDVPNRSPILRFEVALGGGF